MSDEFPTPPGVHVVESDERPGEPLYPGENTIVNRGNHPLNEGEQIHIYHERWADGFDTQMCVADVIVIGDDGDGDIFAIPADDRPEDVDRVYRIRSDMKQILGATIISRPKYDEDSGEYTVTKEVQRRGSDWKNIHEARTTGQTVHYTQSGGSL
jgi:hypothetical protein